MLPARSDISPYLEDASGYRGFADQVLLPRNLDELREIVTTAAASSTPVTISGAGTGLTGARVPQGGSVISLERFRQLEISPGVARCGVGVSLSDLQAAAAKTRQFLGPNPTESLASIGGAIATNAGGARSFRYGPVGRQLLSLEVTFMDGRTVRFRRGDKVDFPYRTVRMPRTTKSSAGYTLIPDLEWLTLLAGSEGTLGIVTEAELMLQPDPPAILSGIVFFPSEDLALDAVDHWRPLPGLRLLESIDARGLDFLRPRYPALSPLARAALMMEQDLSADDDPQLDAWADRLGAQSALEESSWFGLTAADRERFREFRHALPAVTVEIGRQSGCCKFSTDFAVPLEHNREMYNYYRRCCDEIFPNRYTIFGHIGDANVHVNLLPHGPQDAPLAESLMEDFAHKVISLDGTVAAEHGIGKQKGNLLKLMYSNAEIQAMRDVKSQLDPQWLLGRGTILDL